MKSAVRTKRFRAKFTSVGNPDFGQFAPVSNPQAFEGESVEEVVKAYRDYCVRWNMGGGNEAIIRVAGAGVDAVVGKSTAFVIFSGKACHPREKESEFNTPRPLTRREVATLNGSRLTGTEPKCERCGDLRWITEEAYCEACRRCRDCSARTDRFVIREGAFLCAGCDDAVPPTTIRVEAFFFPEGTPVPSKKELGEGYARPPRECEVYAVGPVEKESEVRELLELRLRAMRLDRDIRGEKSVGAVVRLERRFK